jgi:CMP-N,N'-diacetyllegionaminic acid synthase
VTEHQVVAIVPARAGSKGIPRKNLQVLAGRSLLQWTVDLALSMSEIDRCIVSTDGTEIAQEARRLGAEVHDRPPHLATDGALVIDSVRDLLSTHHGGRPGIAVLLQPTSPLRSVDDVRGCLRALSAGADSAVTVTQASLHPDLAVRVDGEVLHPFRGDVEPWTPRQQLPHAYELTGSVYAFWASRLPPTSRSLMFGRVCPVVVPRWRSVDIDEPFELTVAEALLRQPVQSL